MEVRDAVPANDSNEASADGFTLVDLRFGATEVVLFNTGSGLKYVGMEPISSRAASGS
jgi:hypothetical protein